MNYSIGNHVIAKGAEMKRPRIVIAVAAGIAVLLIAACASNPEPMAEEERAAEPAPEDGRVPVESELASWFDRDGDGRLNEREIEVLRNAVFRAIHEPHEVRNPLDELLDENGDGVVEPHESVPVLAPLIAERLHQLHEFAPRFVEAFDGNESGRLERDEVELALDYLVFNPELREPHPIWHRADRFMDRNDDGRVDERELAQFLGPLATRIAVHPVDVRRLLEEIRTAQAGPHPVDTMLDELADLNRNGELEEHEREMLDLAMRGPHPVETELDELLDFNGNGRVDQPELAEAERAAGVMINIPDDIRVEVQTPTDRLLDANEDGFVDAREIEIAAFDLVAFPHDRRDRHPLDRVADENQDGFVDEEELLIVLDRYFRPHPVDPDLRSDRELDRNENGFVEPEEIGVAAGGAVGTPIPPVEDLAYGARLRAEIIGRVRGEGGQEPRDVDATERRAPDEPDADQEDSAAEPTAETEDRTAEVEQEEDATLLQRRLGLIEDTQVAVVGISAATESITHETISGLVVFVENAFVNVNRVTVVDRQNIDAIVSEYEFQVSDLTDRDTAVEIGQLAGADVIVVGSLSAVGSQYYLNIKLISVVTGEILGSSIADASSEDEFFTMCNNAVYRLFQL
jgi:Ca2+-binding EF-hand superfamily protein